MSLTALRTLVGTDDLSWLAVPGDYVCRAGVNRTDRSRLARIAKKNGLALRSSWDSGILTVDLRPAP